MMTISPGGSRPSLESQMSGSKRHSIATYAHDYDFFTDMKDALKDQSDLAVSENKEFSSEDDGTPKGEASSD